MNMKKAFKALKKAEQAVSPVVATLMLVLVAAAAAVGVSVFLNNFQEKAEGNVADSSAARVIHIGGSSTVYEFSLAAIDDFELANPGITIDLQSGGSGSGRDGVCNGALDIGAASSPIEQSHQDKCVTLSGGKTMQVFKVATDGVVFVTDPSNTHCVGVPSLTQAQAREIYTTNAEETGDATGTFTGTASPVVLDTDADGEIHWDEVPDSAGGLCTGDVLVQIYDRSDPGGTSEIASEKLFGEKQSQLEGFGLTLPSSSQGDGNQGVGNIASGDADGLWFTSYGYAVAQGWNVGQFGKTTPIAPSSSNIKSETYDATRPIQYMTLGEPGPIEQLWLDFVMNSHRNQVFAEEADFESIY